MLAMLLLLSSAHAGDFGRAELVEGTPDFTGCLASTDCADAFYGFLSESLIDQGFAMQHQATMTSATVRGAPGGGVVGGGINTFPFGDPPENLSGKAENTQFSPVFPSIQGGRVQELDGGRRLGLGGAFLPPIPVDGASALLLAVDASLAWEQEAGAWGVESDLSFVRAKAPVAATDEQLEDRENWSNPDNLDPVRYAEVCGTEGCKDTFLATHLGLRGARSWQLGIARPHVQAGVNVIHERLSVQYDATTWALFAIQPVVAAGVGLEPGERVFLHAGGRVGLRQPNQNRDGEMGLFYRFEGSAGWRF
jgi:hypothetical protein